MSGEPLIEQVTQENVSAVHAAPVPEGMYQPVDFTIPVGPIFNFVSGEYQTVNSYSFSMI